MDDNNPYIYIYTIFLTHVSSKIMKDTKLRGIQATSGIWGWYRRFSVTTCHNDGIQQVICSYEVNQDEAKHGFWITARPRV